MCYGQNVFVIVSTTNPIGSEASTKAENQINDTDEEQTNNDEDNNVDEKDDNFDQ